jgi:hypothetical protein
MSDDPIQLSEGQLLATIEGVDAAPNRLASPLASTLRCKRLGPRKACSRIAVCFSTDPSTGPVEQVECPVFDISVTGIAIEFDRPLKSDARGSISFWSVGLQPVRVGCTVRRCRQDGRGHYVLGLRFDRRLGPDEVRPAPLREGREVAPGARPRKLRCADDGESPPMGAPPAIRAGEPPAEPLRQSIR